MGLTDRQRRFVEHYVALGNGAQAARQAGYKDGAGIYETASDLLRKPEIRQAIDDRQANLANELGLTRQWVLDGLRQEAVDGDSPPAARIKARELIGKAHGMWVDRAQVDVASTVVYTLDLGSPLGDESVDEEAEG